MAALLERLLFAIAQELHMLAMISAGAARLYLRHAAVVRSVQFTSESRIGTPLPLDPFRTKLFCLTGIPYSMTAKAARVKWA
jgi:hypothetical protein